MDFRYYLVIFITLVVAAVFLYVWKRRDEGIVPGERLPDARREKLDGSERS